MKDEIKEILKNIWYRLDCDTLISKRYGIELDKNECKILKNYITNLQEENKKLSKQHLATINKLIETQEENERLKKWDCNKDSRNSRQRVANRKLIKEKEDYKDRIDKAIEYIERKRLTTTNEITNGNVSYILDILQGEDNE